MKWFNKQIFKSCFCNYQINDNTFQNVQSPLSSLNIINDDPQVHKEIEEHEKMLHDEKEQFFIN